MCSRYSCPGNGSPPGNRPGTYPGCGRPLTRPRDAVVTPATTRSRVDFPDPFGPSTRISRPPGTSTDTSLTTHGCRTPYRLPTASSRIRASAKSSTAQRNGHASHAVCHELVQQEPRTQENSPHEPADREE